MPLLSSDVARLKHNCSKTIARMRPLCARAGAHDLAQPTPSADYQTAYGLRAISVIAAATRTALLLSGSSRPMHEPDHVGANAGEHNVSDDQL